MGHIPGKQSKYFSQGSVDEDRKKHLEGLTNGDSDCGKGLSERCEEAWRKRKEG